MTINRLLGSALQQFTAALALVFTAKAPEGTRKWI
jgi:hypothetical protein